MMGRFYEPRSGRRNLLGELLRVAHFDQMLPSSGGYQSHVCNQVNRCFGTVISHYIQKSLPTLRLSHRIRLIVQQESNAELNSPLEPHPFYSWNRKAMPSLTVHWNHILSTLGICDSVNLSVICIIALIRKMSILICGFFVIILCYYCKITTNRPVWWT